MPPTKPYTPTVMMRAMPTSTASCVQKSACATAPSVMAMISADRMKSVRTAPLILSFSIAARSAFGSSSAACSSASCVSASSLCRNLWATFSKPSKHRKAPPTISSGVTAQGAKALMASAAGTRMALLSNEPLATAHTTGISRLADTPVTCCAFSARSSPSTPAVFCADNLVSTATSSAMAALLRAATLVMTATSSRTVAMSSSSISRLEATVNSLC